MSGDCGAALVFSLIMTWDGEVLLNKRLDFVIGSGGVAKNMLYKN